MNSGNITIPCNPEPFPQVTDGAKKREQVSSIQASSKLYRTSIDTAALGCQLLAVE